MELLASCSLEKSRTFNGSLSIPDDDGKTMHRVSLNVVVGDESEDEVFAGVNKLAKCITFAGNTKATKCPMGLEGKVFNEYSLEEFRDSNSEPVSGVVTLVRLPDDFSHMLTLKTLCIGREDIRLIGGKLLNIEGVRIGRFDGNKPVVCNGVYDSFLEVDIDNLEGIKEKIKKVKVVEVKEKKAKEKKDKAPAEKKVSKKVVAFNSMFGGEGEEF